MSAETVTILLGFLALAGGQAATLLTLILRMDRERKETNQRLEDVRIELNKRFDETSRDIGELRERMAKLEGSLEGFLAGQRGRSAA